MVHRHSRQLRAWYDDQCVIAYLPLDPDAHAYALQFIQLPLDDMKLVDTLWLTPERLIAKQLCQPHQKLLAVHLDRVGFDALLFKSVHDTYQPHLYHSEASWRSLLERSWVRVRWLDVTNMACAFQVGLRGKSLLHFANGGWIIDMDDPPESADGVLSPHELVYPLYNPETAYWLDVDP